VDTLFGIVKALQKEGISVLFVSHKLNEVLAISEEITVLRNGRKVAEGSARQFDHGGLVRCMTGRELAQRCRGPVHAPVEPPVLRVEGLGRRGAFEDVHLELHRGEIVGATGLLGSGRTELALSLVGLEAADAGTVWMDGRHARIRSVRDAMAHGMAYVPEDRLTEGLFMERSTERNLVATSLRGLLNRIGLLDRERMRAQASGWIEQLGIKTPSVATPVQHLSGGNQQKVVLARWLAGHPRILILNGPTVGVDIGAKADIHAQMRTLAGRGVGILVFSDDLTELAQTCDRILLMHRGRIIGQLQGDDCNEEELLRRLGELR
jgi:simple sugar transport system ATP-binding protein